MHIKNIVITIITAIFMLGTNSTAMSDVDFSENPVAMIHQEIRTCANLQTTKRTDASPATTQENDISRSVINDNATESNNEEKDEEANLASPEPPQHSVENAECEAQDTATSPADPELPQYSVGDIEYEVLELVNAYREENGLHTLSLNHTLCALASVRAQEASIKWSHERPDGTRYYTVFTDYNISRARLVGENLGANLSTPQGIVDAWIASDGHRANLLHEQYSKIGIAIYTTDNGMIYIAQLFSN